MILHFILPLLILVFIILHIYFLHKDISNIYLSLNNNIYFSKFLVMKDLVTFFVCVFLLVFYSKYQGIDCENFRKSNPIFSPSHIKPEWYFLYAYAILRSIPNKILGVIFIILAIFNLYRISLIPNYVYLYFFPITTILVLFFIINFCELT